jgi:hypothetical protein
VLAVMQLLKILKSSASGLYQYTDSTWKRDAARSGVDTTKYPTAGSAPAGTSEHQVADDAVTKILAEKQRQRRSRSKCLVYGQS